MKQLNDYILERGLFTKSNYKDAASSNEDKLMYAMDLLNLKDVRSLTINNQGEIDYCGTENIDIETEDEEILYPFGIWRGRAANSNINVWESNLVTLKNMPYDIHNMNLCIGMLPHLTSLKGFPAHVGGNLILSDLQSLKTLNDLTYAPTIDGNLFIYNTHFDSKPISFFNHIFNVKGDIFRGYRPGL